MSIKQQITATDGIYFLTITCYNWLPSPLRETRLETLAFYTSGVRVFLVDSIIDLMDIDLSKKI